MRSYLGLSLGLSFCLMFAVACSDDDGTGGSGGTAGTGGSAGTGGAAGEGGAGGTPAVGETIVKEISLGCGNSAPIGAQFMLGAELSVTAPAAISPSQEFDASLSGTGILPAGFLDAAQGLVLGGLKQAVLLDVKYVAQVRSGATIVGSSGDVPGVALEPDASMYSPGLTQFCTYPPTTICTTATEDDDCVVAPCKDAVILVDIPFSEDCAPGGACDDLGKLEGATSQCALNGFCVTDGLTLPLLEVTQAYMAEASGDVLFGWADEGLDNNTFDSMTNLYTIPKPPSGAGGDPLDQGFRVNAGLVVLVECVMGVDEGEDPMDAENTLVGLTPDTDLISFPIAP